MKKNMAAHSQTARSHSKSADLEPEIPAVILFDKP